MFKDACIHMPIVPSSTRTPVGMWFDIPAPQPSLKPIRSASCLLTLSLSISTHNYFYVIGRPFPLSEAVWLKAKK